MVNPAFKQMSTPDLWREFKAAWSALSSHLRHVAELYVELTERGEDVSAFNLATVSQYFVDIAHGRLDPAFAWQNSSYPPLVRAVATLVPEEQAKLAKPGATVAVAVEGSQTEVVNVRPAHLKVDQIKQVFVGGRIRTPAQQRRDAPHKFKAVRKAPALPMAAATPVKPWSSAPGKPVAQLDPDGVIRPAGQAAWSEQLADNAPAATRDAMLFSALGLTPDQRDQLQAAAKARGVSCVELTREALVTAGALSGSRPRGRSGKRQTCH